MLALVPLLSPPLSDGTGGSGWLRLEVSARCRPLVASADGNVVALDFDGVLCDSEPELTRSAWRAACELWPDVMARASEMAEEPWRAGARKAWTGGDWEPQLGIGPDELPNWLAAKMRLLRPQIETGYESLLLMRLCVDEALAARRARGGERPLTPGEIGANWDQEMRDVLLARYALPQQKAIETLGGARDAWIESDLTGWLGANAFYDGVVEAVQEAVDDGTEVYIVTTKQRRFAQELLRSARLHLDDEHVFGLGSGPKVRTLRTLQQAHPSSTLTLVEDRVQTLRTVANEPSLFGCRLVFARWGYSDSEQQAAAASMPRVRTMSRSEELGELLVGRSSSGDWPFSRDWRDY